MSAHVLIIDDDPIMREIMSHLLRARGYEVEVAVNGEDALYALIVRKPDIICLDMMLPSMNGVELLRRIRTHPEFRTLPVILLSSTGQGELIDEATALGIASHLSKPVTSDTLTTTIEKVLEGVY